MPRPRLDLDDYLPYLINRVGATLVERFTASPLKRRRLSIAMWRVLAALSDNGGQRQVDLGGMTSIDASTLSRMVSRLVRLGYVTRGRAKASRREVVVRLAPRGRAALARLIPVARRFETAAISGIPQRDLVAAKRALRRMFVNLARARD